MDLNSLQIDILLIYIVVYVIVTLLYTVRMTGSKPVGIGVGIVSLALDLVTLYVLGLQVFLIILILESQIWELTHEK